MAMIARRLTKAEKHQILMEFRIGGTANDMAKKYQCSANTINRTVKSLLTNEEYHLLKEERSKIKKDKVTLSRIEGDENDFAEIAPLISSFGFETEEKKVDCQNLEKVNLPEILYMLVDKKIELEVQHISDLPEWGFLPENELKRSVILLFSNQRSAKRSCSRNQKVIKIPNPRVFSISKSYLLSKGITRLILEDSLISLES